MAATAQAEPIDRDPPALAPGGEGPGRVASPGDYRYPLAVTVASGVLLLLTGAALGALTYPTLLLPVEYLPVDNSVQHSFAAMTAATILVVAIATGLFWATLLASPDLRVFARLPRISVLLGGLLVTAAICGLVGWGLVWLDGFRFEAIRRVGEDPTAGLVLDPHLVAALEATGFVLVAILAALLQLALSGIAPSAARRAAPPGRMGAWTGRANKTREASPPGRPSRLRTVAYSRRGSPGRPLPASVTSGGVAKLPPPVQAGRGPASSRSPLMKLAAVLSVAGLTFAASVVLSPVVGGFCGSVLALWWAAHLVPGPEYRSLLRDLALRNERLAVGVIGAGALVAGMVSFLASGPGPAAFAFLGTGAALGFRAMGGDMAPGRAKRSGNRPRPGGAFLLVALAPIIAALVAIAGFGANGGERGTDHDAVSGGSASVNRSNGSQRELWRTQMTMPGLGPGNAPARPLSIVLVVPRTKRMGQEVRKFSDWLVRTQRPESQMLLLRSVGGAWKVTWALPESSLRREFDQARDPVSIADAWLDQKQFRHFTRMTISFLERIPAGLNRRATRVRVRPAAEGTVTDLRRADAGIRGSFAAVAALHVIHASGEVLARAPEATDGSFKQQKGIADVQLQGKLLPQGE